MQTYSSDKIIPPPQKKKLNYKTKKRAFAKLGNVFLSLTFLFFGGGGAFCH